MASPLNMSQSCFPFQLQRIMQGRSRRRCYLLSGRRSALMFVICACWVLATHLVRTSTFNANLPTGELNLTCRCGIHLNKTSEHLLMMRVWAPIPHLLVKPPTANGSSPIAGTFITDGGFRYIVRQATESELRDRNNRRVPKVEVESVLSDVNIRYAVQVRTRCKGIRMKRKIILLLYVRTCVRELNMYK